MNKTHIFSMDPNSHKMQSGKVVKSKLRMYIEISQRTTLNLTKCIWVCVYTQALCETSTLKF